MIIAVIDYLNKIGNRNVTTAAHRIYAGRNLATDEVISDSKLLVLMDFHNRGIIVPKLKKMRIFPPRTANRLGVNPHSFIR